MFSITSLVSVFKNNLEVVSDGKFIYIYLLEHYQNTLFRNKIKTKYNIAEFMKHDNLALQRPFNWLE